MSFPSVISKSALAKLLGLTPRRIGQLTAEGVLKKNARGDYNTTVAVAAYISYREELAADKLGGPDFHAARARKMEADATLAEVNLLERRGKLIETDWFILTVTRAEADLKAMLLALPSREAPRLANKSANELQVGLKHAIHTVLHRRSQLLQNAADEIRAKRKGIPAAEPPLEQPPEEAA
jgi:phage terminase Nu1 subunit (DNA packaging protein)